ncbi:hypothetical protein PCLA_11f0238 [Pseudomonas citronellolis]|nr:hypothetical protein PCLA_11f0238 [Pseudomonas citronellolis]
MRQGAILRGCLSKFGPETGGEAPASFHLSGAVVQRRWPRLAPLPHPSPLPEGEGAVWSGWGIWSHPETPTPPRHFRECGNPVFCIWIQGAS